MKPFAFRLPSLVCAIACAVPMTGCSNLLFRIRAVEAEAISQQLIPESRDAYVGIDLAQLTRPPAGQYRLDAGDTLAVLLPGIEKDPSSPLTMSDFPVINLGEYFKEPPAVGLPVPILEDGTVRLPLIDPINIAGLTVDEATQAVSRAYIDAQIATSAFKPAVSLARRRTYSVTVIREDTENLADSDNQRLSTSMVVELPAYQNYVLNALVQTGGLPGLTAKPVVRIIRQSRGFDSMPAGVMMLEPPPTGNLPYNINAVRYASCTPQEVTIPLRVPIGVCPQIPEEHITLLAGDIVYVESREAEVFYTGGLLPGGQYLLPRDYDIDIFEAMAIAGYSYNSGGQGGNQFVPSTGIVPTSLYIFRKRGDGCETTIHVDLEEAANCQAQRLKVKAGDKLLLRYSTKEELLNFGIFSFFTFGIRELLR